MAEAGELERLAEKAMREVALSQSAGVAKYGNLLNRFGKGEIASTAFGEEMLKLALEEGVRYAQDAIKLGTAYLGFVSQMTRAADVTTRAAVRKATQAAPRRSTSRARKGRARRKAKTSS